MSLVLFAPGPTPFSPISAHAQQDDLAQGRQHFLEGRFDDAVVSLRRAVETSDAPADRVEARLTLALIAQTRANDERTLVELQWALTEDAGLSLDPDVYSPKMQALLTRAKEVRFDRLISAKRLFNAGDLQPALEEFRLAAALLETSPEPTNLDNTLDALLSAALIQQTLGQNEAAQELFRRGLRLRPALELDSEFYSPSTMALFQQVKSEAPEALAQARRQVAAGNHESAIDALDTIELALLNADERTEHRVLRAYAFHQRADRDTATRLLNEVLRDRPNLALAEDFYDQSFVTLNEGLRLVATRGLPQIAIIMSSNAIVHDLSRQGFEEVTVASYHPFVLPDDGDEARQRASEMDLLYAIGQDAEDFVADCCAQLPVIAGNVTQPSDADRGAHGAVLWNASFGGQVEIAMRTLPGVERIGIVHGEGRGASMVEALRRELTPLGITLVAESVRSESDVASAVNGLIRRVDLFWYLPDPILASVSAFQTILESCDHSKTPMFAFHESLVQGGAYVGVSADFEALGRQAGRMALRYLSSRDEATLAIEPGDASRIVINLGAADRLGLKPDASLVSLAGSVLRN